MLEQSPVRQPIVQPNIKRGFTTKHKYKNPFKRLSIIIPCYNEETTIGQLLGEVIKVDLLASIEKEIIVIDDYSMDNSHQIIISFVETHRDTRVIYIRHSSNQGKGAAIQSGLCNCTGEYVIIQDADLEYSPQDYNKMLKPILLGNADVVYGSRFTGGNPQRVLFFWHKTGNRILTLVSNILSNTHLTDAHTCYKVLGTALFKSLNLQERRFAFDAELNMKLSRVEDLKIFEVGISYNGRTFKEGKKIRFRDAIRTIYCLFKYRFSTNSFGRTRKTLQIKPMA
jgi:glycosyltransferase involved in cell wall biosynthesis